jgi:hypothetical protein
MIIQDYSALKTVVLRKLEECLGSIELEMELNNLLDLVEEFNDNGGVEIDW